MRGIWRINRGLKGGELGPGDERTHFRLKGWHSSPRVRKEGGDWVPGKCPLVSSVGWEEAWTRRR